ncbi:kinesin-like protein KIN-14R isoform X2 [Ricinus communis]|uniref:kinesin-like protein KIN-14R isoform X2 n=1 Tax=Ricinus communis TaxID=3988 RepID=UPI00201B26AC|nr:kinesin-like protein KIN-14R isoform X2 [Ricinus communis]
MENTGQDFLDSILCISGSKLIQSGLITSHITEKPLIFTNAGGGSIKLKERNFEIDIEEDKNFNGGDVLRTEESIINGGDLPIIYQSARFGSFCYQFTSLPTGDYFVDLHFAEIVNTNGPKGMRVFDVFIQEEKVISELDIYSIVGANKPLQVLNVLVSVGEDREILIRFEGILGSPIVSGICIKQAPEFPSFEEKHEHIICDNCATEIKISQSQKVATAKCISKYEKKIEELNALCQVKADECYEAWMSLTAASQQLEKARMEVDNRFFQNMCLDQALKKQSAELSDISGRYKCDKLSWFAAIEKLEKQVQMMKIEQSQLSHEAHECATSISDLNKMIFSVQALVDQYDDLKLKFNKEQAERKKLFNQVQEAKGNIRVFCRCRPLSMEETSAGYQTVVDFDAAKHGDLGVVMSSSTKKTFKFDRVFTPRDDQVDVFVDVSPMAISVLDGYNVCIFAYGQTGTGKTFTMEGTEGNRGVNYQTLQTLFRIAGERKETVKYDISVSVLEVYNEQIRDLLATSPTAKRLEIKQFSEGVHHVPGLVEAKVENIKEVWDVLQAGSNARAVGSNNVNEHSSRSHCMLCTMVRAKSLINGECTKSKLWLVDLAGSERLAKTEVQGERLKEAQNINRSLSALGDVISALATKSSHIPYRNSKLTHLLQDSLGGDSKTMMFVQISPSERDLGETLSSLNFATRVRGVELGPAKKQIDLVELQKLKMMLDKAKQELRSKDDVMYKLEENFQNLEGKAKSKDQLCKNQQEKTNELERQLAMKTELCGKLENQLLQLSQGMKGKEEICTNFQQKVKELENKLKEREQAESVNLQYKVNELENRMKERAQEFEIHSKMLQQKVFPNYLHAIFTHVGMDMFSAISMHFLLLQIRELENKLTMERDYSDPRLLQQKIKVLEEKLREHEQGECISKLWSAEKLGATPIQTTSSRLGDVDSSNRRSLSASNRSMNQGSLLLKGPDSLREVRRKRDIPSKGTENNFLLATSLLEKKTSSPQISKLRHLDPSKVLSRITRNAKPTINGQTAYSRNNTRINRDQVTGVKDNNNKLKVWLR